MLKYESVFYFYSFFFFSASVVLAGSRGGRGREGGVIVNWGFIKKKKKTA